jgi:glutathione S-transferase
MTVTITAFQNSPDRGAGQARDFRVRWALGEVGQPYDVRLLSFEAMKQPAHLNRNPFGQIPTYEEGALTLFETGAIILHIAERHAGLLPADPDARARAIMWMFAALNTMEPPIVEAGMAFLFERDKEWFAARQPMLMERLRNRLDQLAAHLGEDEWLDGDFSAGDLLMVTVLRILEDDGLVDDYANLAAYVSRGTTRPAFRKALADQMAGFTGEAPDWWLKMSQQKEQTA